MTVKLEETLGLEFQKYSNTKTCALCLICIMKLFRLLVQVSLYSLKQAAIYFVTSYNHRIFKHCNCNL